MNDRRVRVGIAALTGLALAALPLLVGQFTAVAGPGPTARSEQGQAPPTASSSVRAWTSGRVPIAQDTCRMFNLSLGGDPDDYVVELWFFDTHEGIGIHCANYGGKEFQGDWHGGHWEQLTASAIRLCRRHDDHAADQVRVRISIALRTYEYSGNWTNINVGTTIFTRGLGISGADMTQGSGPAVLTAASTSSRLAACHLIFPC